MNDVFESCYSRVPKGSLEASSSNLNPVLKTHLVRNRTATPTFAEF
ncbi:hypothetical protein [Nostoc sp. MS1]|nr:hypothetical protein [Nostoc sp. MS1]